MEDTVGLVVQLEPEIHAQLKALAKERGVTLTYLATALLNWGAEQTAQRLFNVGVKLPVWFDEVHG